MRDWLFRIMRELVSIALCSRVEWVSREWVWRIPPENEGLTLQDQQRTGEYCTVFQSWVSVQRMSMKDSPRERGTDSSGSSENWWVLHCVPELSECPENEDEEIPQRMRYWLFRIIRELVSIALCSRVEWVSREWGWRNSPENEILALQDHQRTGEYCTVFQSCVSVQRMSMRNFPREWGTGSWESWENWWELHWVPELSECPENEYEGFPQRMRDWLFRLIREMVSIALCSRVEWMSREYEIFPQRIRDWLFRIMKELVTIALCSRVEWVSREWVWWISTENEGLARQTHERAREYCSVFQSWVSVQRMSIKNFPREWGTGSSGSWMNWWVLHCVPELSECPENEYEEFPQRMWDWLFWIMTELVSIALCSRVDWVSREWVGWISPENEGLALLDHQRTGEYCTVFQSWVSVQRMSMKNFPREWDTGSSGSSENWWVLHCVPELSECPENEYEEFPQRTRNLLSRIMRELVSIALCSRVWWVSREWVWRISPENEGLALQIHERTGEYCTVFQSWVSAERINMMNFLREWGTGSSGSWENSWVLDCMLLWKEMFLRPDKCLQFIFLFTLIY